MALDAVTIGRLAEELNDRLKDGKIEKIRQPEKDLLLFGVRRYGETEKLLLRAGGPNARMHLTDRSYENPANAPMFCMLLRKYLKGARILDIRQVNGDRILVMTLEGRTELGDELQLQLVTELMGRAANLILVGEDGRILDCLRRIAPGEYGKRALLPGLRYELPEKPVTEHGPAAEAAPAPGESISALLDARYGGQEQRELQRRRAQELTKTVRRMRDRQQRKLAAQTDELRRTENMEQIRQEAELLKANLYRVHRGDRTLVCENYFEPDSPETVLELDGKTLDAYRDGYCLENGLYLIYARRSDGKEDLFFYTAGLSQQRAGRTGPRRIGTRPCRDPRRTGRRRPAEERQKGPEEGKGETAARRRVPAV